MRNYAKSNRNLVGNIETIIDEDEDDMLNDVSKSVTNSEMTSIAGESSRVSPTSNYGKPRLALIPSLANQVALDEPIESQARMIMPYGGSFKQKQERK